MKRPARASGITEKFEQSNRFYRGKIVETLRTLPASDVAGLPLSVLGPAVRAGYTTADEPWLKTLVEGLQRDGLAVLAEETPPYDVTDGPAEPRVRLP